MKLKRVYAIFLRQMFLLRRNKTRFANIFLWITLDVVLWGFVTKYFSSTGTVHVDLVSTLLGAIILWDFLIRVQQGVMVAFFEDVWSQNFLNLFASPLSVKEYVSGLVLTSIVTSTVGLLFMLVFAGIAFGYNVFVLGTYLFFFLLTLFLFGLALGIFTTGVVLRLGPASEWFAWPIPFLLGPFAGVFYPVSTLPALLRPISKLLPPSYAFEGMRTLLTAGTPDISSLLMGVVLAVFYVLLAYFFFVRIYRLVLRNGLITRFSAESMSG